MNDQADHVLQGSSRMHAWSQAACTASVQSALRSGCGCAGEYAYCECKVWWPVWISDTCLHGLLHLHGRHTTWLMIEIWCMAFHWPRQSIARHIHVMSPDMATWSLQRKQLSPMQNAYAKQERLQEGQSAMCWFLQSYASASRAVLIPRCLYCFVCNTCKDLPHGADSPQCAAGWEVR